VPGQNNDIAANKKVKDFEGKKAQLCSSMGKVCYFSGVKWRGCKADHPLLNIVEVNRVGIYISTCPNTLS